MTNQQQPPQQPSTGGGGTSPTPPPPPPPPLQTEIQEGQRKADEKEGDAAAKPKKKKKVNRKKGEDVNAKVPEGGRRRAIAVGRSAANEDGLQIVVIKGAVRVITKAKEGKPAETRTITAAKAFEVLDAEGKVVGFQIQK